MTNNELFSLAGKTALVTGAGIGLGRAIAVSFAQAGAFIGIHYNSSAAEAENTLVEVRAAGSDGVLLQANLTKEDEANRSVDELAQRSGRIDILVNNAGTLLERAKIEECSLELWQRTMDVNMTSAFLVTKRCIPHLRATGSGRIINIISLSTQTGGANGAGAYAAAKGAMAVFTRTLAKELAPQVRTNSICPGVIETRHHEVHSSAEQMEQYRKQTPMGRNGTSEEVAATALYLASDASAFTNGALIDVSGGRFLR